jgi:hypothetical protein
MCAKGRDVKILQQFGAEEATGRTDIAVRVNGLLMKRDHTFNFGPVTTLTVGTGKVVDC